MTGSGTTSWLITHGSMSLILFNRDTLGLLYFFFHSFFCALFFVLFCFVFGVQAKLMNLVGKSTVYVAN